MRKCPPPLPVLLIALVVLAPFAGPAVAEDPPAPPDVPTDPVPTPPGTPADVALWKAAGDVSKQVTSVRWVGNGLHWKLQTDDILGRLDAAAKADPSAAPRLGDLRKKLVDAQVESYEILVGKWPVDPTRVCLYPQSMLGSAMQASAARDNRAQLEEARASASKCVDLARAAVGRTQRANERLAQAIEQAEKALPPLSTVSPPAPAGK